MRALRPVLHFAPALALALTSSLVAAQQSDQAVAERALGPQWKQLSRRAGMIFAGTVLAPVARSGANWAGKTEPLAPGTAAGTTPALQVSFRVDEAIAGVAHGQVLTIRQWTGASSRQRPMRKGQRFLMFLYPPSPLGFTSPVGGALGQIALDPSGHKVTAVSVSLVSTAARQPDAAATDISVAQLERAIRAVRGE